MRTIAPGRIPMRRPGTPGPRGGWVFVSELQRARLLDAAFAVVAEDDYRRMTARRVSGRAGVSNKTFYDLFSDREDCFLAAFDYAVEEPAKSDRPGERPDPAGIPFRLTVRTHRVLCAVAELSAQGSNPNNREVADTAGIFDQGQISKLLSRLEGHGLLQNTGGSTQGIPRAWRLTSRGEEIVRVGQPRNERTNSRPGSPEAVR